MMIKTLSDEIPKHLEELDIEETNVQPFWIPTSYWLGALTF